MHEEQPERRARQRRAGDCGGLCDAEREQLISDIADHVRADLEQEFFSKVGRVIIGKLIWATIATLAALATWARSKSII